MLGARFHDALGPAGATTLFIDAALGWSISDRLRLGAAWRQGFTHARTGGAIGAGSNFASQGWSLDLARADAFKQGDSLGLRISQPLRVASGGLNLTLPTSYDYDTLLAADTTTRLALSPRGRELTTELAWRGPLWAGAASASLFYRRNPGHYASLPNDKGVALSWGVGF